MQGFEKHLYSTAEWVAVMSIKRATETICMVGSDIVVVEEEADKRKVLASG